MKKILLIAIMFSALGGSISASKPVNPLSKGGISSEQRIEQEKSAENVEQTYSSSWSEKHPRVMGIWNGCKNKFEFIRNNTPAPGEKAMLTIFAAMFAIGSFFAK